MPAPFRPAAVLCLAVLAGAGCAGESASPPPSVPERAGAPRRQLAVRITGNDYNWLIRYPGEDGRLGTTDDVTTRRHLHLPANADVAIDLRSDDYVYTFYVPYVDVMDSAMPGQPYTLDFESGPPATHELLGSQMCGFTHPNLLGDVVVQAPQEFDAWLEQARQKG